MMKRGRKRPHYLRKGLLGVWGGLVWFYLAPDTLLIAAWFVLAGLRIFLVPIFVMFVLLFPWPIARYVLIPLGQVRLAYWLTYTSDFTFRGDREGGAAVAGAWALARQRVRDGADTNWMIGKLAVAAPLRGAGAFASCLLLAALDDLEGAHALIEGVVRQGGPTCRRSVRRLACGWLSASSAGRGDWATVAELGRTLGQGGRAAWLLSGVAQVLLREPAAPGRVALWLRWMLAPRRRRTLSLLRRALAALGDPVLGPEEGPPAARAEAPVDVPPPRGALDAALALHASTLNHRAEISSNS